MSAHRRLAGRVHLLPPLRAPHLGGAGQRRARCSGRSTCSTRPASSADSRPPRAGAVALATGRLADVLDQQRDLSPDRQGVRRPRRRPRPARRRGRARARRRLRAGRRRRRARRDRRRRTTCAPPRPGWSPRSPRARPRRAPTSSTSASARPTSSTSPAARSTCPARCSPRATTRRSYNGIKLCRAGAGPVGQDTGLAEIRDAGRAAALPAPPTAPPGTVEQRDLLPAYAAYLRGLVDLSGHPAAEGRRRRRQRHGRPHRARRCSTGLPAATSSRCTSSSTARFPNHEANPLDPANLRRPAGRGPRARRRHRAGLRRRRRPLLRRRRARRAGLAVARSPRWSRPASSPSTRARRSSTT